MSALCFFCVFRLVWILNGEWLDETGSDRKNLRYQKKTRNIQITVHLDLAIQIISIQNPNWPKNAAQTWFLECSSNFWKALPTWMAVDTTAYSISTMCCLVCMSGTVATSTGFGGNRMVPPCMWPTPTCSTWTGSYKAGWSAGQQSKTHVRASVFYIFGQFRFWKDIIWVARWKGLEILIPKHMWKSKIRHQGQK